MNRPQVDLTRPKSIGEVIGDALRSYAAHPALFLTLTLIVVVPFGVIVRLGFGQSLLGGSSAAATRAFLEVVLLSLLLVQPLVSALHVTAVADLGAGVRPQIGTVLRRGVVPLPTVVAAQVVATLGTLLGFVLFIVPGVVLIARLAVVAQIAAIERRSWDECLRRSWQLTRGRALHVLGVLLVAGILSALVNRLVSGVVGAGDGAVQVVVSIALEAILLSFSALTVATLYYDVTARSAQGSPSY